MVCKNCGKKMKADANFCTACGSAVLENCEEGGGTAMDYRKKVLMSLLSVIVTFLITKFICFLSTDDGVAGILWFLVVTGCAIIMIVSRSLFFIHLHKFILRDLDGDLCAVGVSYSILMFIGIWVLDKWGIDAPGALLLPILGAEILPLVVFGGISMIYMIIGFVKHGGIKVLAGGIAVAGGAALALTAGLALPEIFGGRDDSSNSDSSKERDEKINDLETKNNRLIQLNQERTKNYAERRIGSEYAPSAISDTKKEIERNNLEIERLRNTK